MLKKFLLLLSCILFAFYAKASSNNEWVGACETSFPPYNFIEANKPVGMDTEIVELVMSKLGVKLKIENYPWARVVNSLEKGKIDFAWQFVNIPERAMQFILVGPIRDGKTIFMVNDKFPQQDWKSFDDFKGKKVGVVREFKYTPEFDEYKYFTKIVANNNSDLLKKLANYDVDVIIGDLNVLTYHEKFIDKFYNVHILPTPLKVVPRYVGFAKNRKEMADKFQEELNKIKNSQEYIQIINKYSNLK